MYESIALTFEAILNPDDYTSIYAEASTEGGEGCIEDFCWDSETRTKAQGILKTMQTPVHAISFITVMFTLEPVKPLTVKLQQRNQDVYKAYKHVDETIEYIKSQRVTVDSSFKRWFERAHTLLQSVGVDEMTVPRRVGRQTHRNNIPGDSAEVYYKRALAIPFIDNVIEQLENRFNKESRNCAELLLLAPSLTVTDEFNPATAYQSMLTWECHLPSSVQLENELLRWKSFWKRRLQAGDDIPDNLLDTMCSVCKEDFPNIFSLLCIACALPVGSCEAERSFSALRRTKTFLRSKMATVRLTALTLMTQHNKIDLNYDRILEIFVTKHSQRMFDDSILFV